MVDLAFLLITFFMLTTRLQTQNAMSLAMPVPSDERLPVSESRTITVLLGGSERVFWYAGRLQSSSTPARTTFGHQGIRQVLLQQKARIARENGGKDMIVLIKPGDHASYGNLVAALDEIEIAGVKRYAVLSPDKNEMMIADGKRNGIGEQVQ